MINRLKMNKTKTSEQGFAAILVVTTIMIVLSLITVGFARIENRELRQSTDRSLELQSYYASEVGLNFARSYAKSIPLDGTADLKSCYDPLLSPTPIIPLSDYTSSVLPASGDGSVTTQTTCILIDTQPKTITFNPINPGDSPTIFTLNPTTTTLNRLYFSWQSPDAATNYRNDASHSLPTEVTWGNTTGMLRVSIYPTTASGEPTVATVAKSRVYFLYPNSSGTSSISYTTGGSGGFVDGNCGTAVTVPVGASPAFRCTASITNLTGFAHYGISVSALYQPVSLEIFGNTGVAPTVASILPGAQVTFDVTGKSNDTLQRVRGSINTNGTVGTSPYSIRSTQTVCKRLRLPIVSTTGGPAPVTVYDPAVLDDPASTDTNPACTSN